MVTVWTWKPLSIRLRHEMRDMFCTGQVCVYVCVLSVLCIFFVAIRPCQSCQSMPLALIFPGGINGTWYLFTKISDQTRQRGHPFYATTPIGPFDITMMIQQQSCPGSLFAPLEEYRCLNPQPRWSFSVMEKLIVGAIWRPQVRE